MKNPDPLQQRLQQLRDEFDAGFARPVAPGQIERQAVLCFTADNITCAALLTELDSIAKAGPLVPVPSHSPALLGVTAVRARLMPVFSVAALLQQPAAKTQVCWLAILRGRLPAALALDALAGYADHGSIDRQAAGHGPLFVRGSVRHGKELYALLDCTGIYDAITRGPIAAAKDQEPTL